MFRIPRHALFTLIGGSHASWLAQLGGCANGPLAYRRSTTAPLDSFAHPRSQAHAYDHHIHSPPLSLPPHQHPPTLLRSIVILSILFNPPNSLISTTPTPKQHHNSHHVRKDFHHPRGLRRRCARRCCYSPGVPPCRCQVRCAPHCMRDRLLTNCAASALTLPTSRPSAPSSPTRSPATSPRTAATTRKSLPSTSRTSAATLARPSVCLRLPPPLKPLQDSRS